MSKDTEEQSQEQTPSRSENILNQLSEEFETLRQIRHEVGAEEYGPVTFLKVPLIRFAAEELADMANYCRFMYIKLRIMEEELRARGIDISTSSVAEAWSEDEIPPGFASFVSAEEISGFLPKEK